MKINEKNKSIEFCCLNMMNMVLNRETCYMESSTEKRKIFYFEGFQVDYCLCCGEKVEIINE